MGVSVTLEARGGERRGRYLNDMVGEMVGTCAKYARKPAHLRRFAPFFYAFALFCPECWSFEHKMGFFGAYGDSLGNPNGGLVAT